MISPCTVALSQLNLTVGDIAGNVERIRAAYDSAAAEGAELVVFPELAVIGYSPEDLIYTPYFQEKSMAAIEALAQVTAGGGPAILVGHISLMSEADQAKALRPKDRYTNTLYNSVYLLDDGKIAQVQHKHHLPNYGVFDEKRVFERGPLPEVMEWRGRRLGVFVCEDMWGERVAPHLIAQQPDVLISINASPFEAEKQERREALAGRIAKEAGVPLFYLNQVGGQDELVFDGGSLVVNAAGEVAARMAFFAEETILCTLDGEAVTVPQEVPRPIIGLQDSLYLAMMTGLRDYVEKNGFPGVVLGLSGGIDSALTAVVAVDALGAERVHAVMLPSPYTSEMSLEDAAELVEALGVEYHVLPIDPGMAAADEILAPVEGVPCALAKENIQSRLRGLTLMAISNSSGKLLITTGNKSEMAVGYATLYGDMCGAFSVLKDLYKTEVFAVSRWRNEVLPQGALGPSGVVIPERTITRPPSAELREGQVDEDSLPPYDVLDAILKSLVEGRLSVDDMVRAGYEREVVEHVARLLYVSEYKRRQAPPGVKLTTMAFGRDRRFPLTNRFTLYYE